VNSNAQSTNLALHAESAVAAQLLTKCPEWRAARTTKEKDKDMLWTIFVILLVLWLLGLVTSYTFGGFLHILLVVAIAIALIQLISGRRAV
jgi:hypothetical protein